MYDWGVFRPLDQDIHVTPFRPPSPRAINNINPSKFHKQSSIHREQIALFRSQPLLASGELFVKSSRFQRSKKFHAELRGSAIVIFRTPSAAHSPTSDITDVISILSVPSHTFSIVQKLDNTPRIYISSEESNSESLMYIRPTTQDLDIWNEGLARAKAWTLPSLSSLTIESIIGQGGGGKVFLVRRHPDKTLYALKVIGKAQVFKSAKAFCRITAERRIMGMIEPHPFLLPMDFAFQTSSNLFIGTPFCGGGDLATYIRNHGFTTTPPNPLAPGEPRKRALHGRLSECQTRRIASELVLALGHLHKHGMVYRDLKLENVLIDENGHIKLGDFGLAKKVGGEGRGMGGRTKSVCGTRNYLPPEMLYGKDYGTEADMWSLGVLLYRMLVGAFPYDGVRCKEVFAKIKRGSLRIPTWVSAEARALLNGLLRKDGGLRFSIGDVKKHAFFRGVVWREVLQGNGGTCVQGVQAGCVEEALGNFELSKLHAVTLGEVIGEEQGVGSMVVGFEYGKVEGVVEPLGVKQKGGGLLRKLSSIDYEGLMTLRKTGSRGSSGSRD